MFKYLFIFLLLFVLAVPTYAQNPTSVLDQYVYEMMRNSAMSSTKNFDWIVGLGSSGVTTLTDSETSSAIGVESVLASDYLLRQVTIISSVVITVTFTGSGINGDTGANTSSITLPAGAHNIPITNVTSFTLTNTTSSTTDVYAYMMGSRLKRSAP